MEGNNKVLIKYALGLLAAAVLALILAYPLSSEISPSFQLALSPDVMSFDDGLDVRDAQGRPVSSPKAKADLRALFVSGLCRLLMRPEVPRVARVLSVLERTLDVFRHGLCRALPKSWGDFLDLWSPPAKKLNLMPLFLVAALLALLTAGRPRFQNVVPRTDSLLSLLSCTVLRC